jgi:hypothetical protein
MLARRPPPSIPTSTNLASCLDQTSIDDTPASGRHRPAYSPQSASDSPTHASKAQRPHPPHFTQMLLRRQGQVGEQFEDVAGDVALECPEGFAFGLAFADAPVEVGAGLGLVFGPDDRDGVDRVVGLAVAAAVESVPISTTCLAHPLRPTGSAPWQPAPGPNISPTGNTKLHSRLTSGPLDLPRGGKIDPGAPWRCRVGFALERPVAADRAGGLEGRLKPASRNPGKPCGPSCAEPRAGGARVGRGQAALLFEAATTWDP